MTARAWSMVENDSASDTFLNRVLRELLLDGIEEVNQDGLIRVPMKADTLAAELLPELGGKVASLQCKGVELLQAPLRPYASRSATMRFEESDASGFDECLPSVSACKIAGGIRIPDHGEFWRLPCKVEERSESEVLLTATGTVLPLRFERRLTLRGDSLRVDYRLENAGAAEVPYVWSAHPLFAVDEGDVVTLPASTSQVCVEGSARDRIGTKGAQLRWPKAELPCGVEVDLSRAGNISDGIGDKIYAKAPPEGWAAVERRRHGLRVMVEFDSVLTPWLGLWLCYGGWPDRDGARQQCVALEPCTAPGDSLEEAMGKSLARKLAPGQSDAWWMSIHVTGCEQ